jgi:hypothetical protein
VLALTSVISFCNFAELLSYAASWLKGLRYQSGWIPITRTEARAKSVL